MGSERAVEAAPYVPSRRLLLLAAAFGLGVGLIVPAFLVVVRGLGHNIPQFAIEQDYAKAVVWAAVLTALPLLAPVSARDRQALLVLWVAHCVVTLVFMLPYESRYGLDAYDYFRASVDVGPGGGISLDPTRKGGTAAVMQLSWWLARPVQDSYHALKVTFSMFGLMAAYIFYRAAALVRPVDTKFLYILGLFPTILFWSSIIGKDPLAALGIAIYCYGALGLLYGRGRLRWLWLLAGITLAAVIRVWLAPILLLPVSIVWIGHLRGFRRKAVAFAIVGISLGVAFHFMSSHFATDSATELLELTGQVSGSTGWQGGSSQQVDVDFDNPISLVKFVPIGIFTSIFRPLPGEVMNAFGLLAGLEGLVLLGLLGYALLHFRRAQLREPVVQWAVLLILTWGSVYGFFSSRNFGAGSRFKLQILPVVIGLLLYLVQDARERAHAALPLEAGAES